MFIFNTFTVLLCANLISTKTKKHTFVFMQLNGIVQDDYTESYNAITSNGTFFLSFIKSLTLLIIQVKNTAYMFVVIVLYFAYP